jgi:8-oxo-dGTP pyrophosphatase MutT (NUDIX family)
MAPPYRNVPSEAYIQAQNPRQAAVLLLLVPRESDWHLVFTKRQPSAGVHSGQISFPGGRTEATDRNKFETAIRETEEEIGIPANCIELLGALSPLYIPPSNYLVDPVVGYIREPLCFQPQESEVAEIFEIPIQWFNTAGIRISQHIPHLPENPKVPGYLFNSHFIWGATAMMLAEFLAIISTDWATERIHQ